MLLTVAEFRERVTAGLPGLVRDLQALTGRHGREEAQAWSESLSAVDAVFQSPSLQDVHVYFGGRGRLELEYRLPASSSWCDMVLLGRRREGPSAVILELKNWVTRGDRPGSIEGLMSRQGTLALHPSDQVKGYAEYCRRFHEVVLDRNADVHGCVVFTKDSFFGPYLDAPNDQLAEQYPCFTSRDPKGRARLVERLSSWLSNPDEDFARAFDAGGYRQSRSFVRQVGAQIANAENRPFELLDHQRLGHHAALQAVETALFDTDGNPKSHPRKTVLVIAGPPGSGKSVIAARLWASLAQNPNLQAGDLVITSTSAAQENNWKSLFSAASGERAAEGVIKKATGYSPLTTHDLGTLRKKNPGRFDNMDVWRENLRHLAAGGHKPRLPDNQYLVSIVDEAHALINPEHSDARGQFGFPVQFGPLGYHIIRGSVVSVFLMDGRQSFRERETTTLDDIRAWAAELKAEVLPTVSLEGAQFRCAGSSEYVGWVDAVLSSAGDATCADLAQRWRRSMPQPHGSSQAAERPASYGGAKKPRAVASFMTFTPCDSPLEVEERLRSMLRGGSTARLVASYARQWKTQKATAPHRLPDADQDFHLTFDHEGHTHHWSRIWNYQDPKHGYAGYVQAPKGTQMGEDPLCEVGCPYTVRGFDFDYVGLLWFSDVIWRGHGWRVEPNHVHETGLSRHVQRAKKELDPEGPAHRALRDKLLLGYRILLTRAIKGVFCWFEDAETRRRIEACLGAAHKWR